MIRNRSANGNFSYVTLWSFKNTGSAFFSSCKKEEEKDNTSFYVGKKDGKSINYTRCDTSNFIDGTTKIVNDSTTIDTLCLDVNKDGCSDFNFVLTKIYIPSMNYTYHSRPAIQWNKLLVTDEIRLELDPYLGEKYLKLSNYSDTIDN